MEDLAHLTNEDLDNWALAASAKLSLALLRDGRDMSELKFKRNIVFWKDSLRVAVTAPNGMEMLLQQVALRVADRGHPF